MLNANFIKKAQNGSREFSSETLELTDNSIDYASLCYAHPLAHSTEYVAPQER